jgi:D-proline reductase (dithiol) PrdB
MQPIAYVARLNEFYKSQGFPAYNWTINDAAPLTPMRKPLDRCRIAMLTSGGVSRKDSAPFDPNARNNLRLDTIEKSTPADFLQIHDAYYNHADADRDINCIFPIDRLRELANERIIESVAPHHYSGFMGRIYTRRAVVNEAAPRLASQLREEGVDAFLLVPA